MRSHEIKLLELLERFLHYGPEDVLTGEGFFAQVLSCPHISIWSGIVLGHCINRDATDGISCMI